MPSSNPILEVHLVQKHRRPQALLSQIPPPEIVRCWLAASIREAALLRCLLRLAVRKAALSGMASEARLPEDREDPR